MTAAVDGERALDEPIDEDDVLVLRRGPGANCSSIGSALDVLFMTGVIAGAILAAATAALAVRASEASAPPSKKEETPSADPS